MSDPGAQGAEQPGRYDDRSGPQVCGRQQVGGCDVRQDKTEYVRTIFEREGEEIKMRSVEIELIDRAT